MAITMPIEIVRALAILNTVVEVLDGVNDIKSLVEDPTAGLAPLYDAIQLVRDDIAALPQFGEGFETRVRDALGAIEDKAGTAQYVLTGALGYLYPPLDYPTLDLRPMRDAVTRFAPGDAGLFDWLSYLVHQRPPWGAGTAHLIAHVSSSGRWEIGSAWALRTNVTSYGTSRSSTDSAFAPVYETLGRLALGADDGWYQRTNLNFLEQLHPLDRYQPRYVAIDPAPDVELDLYRIAPQGEI